MKKFIIVLLFAVCAGFINQSSAQQYKTALGVRFSSAPAAVNNSVSIKHFVNDRMAIEGLFSFGDPIALGLLAEMHKPLANSGLQWFYGGGGYISFEKTYNPNKQKDVNNTNFGAQGVIGLDYKFPNVPLNLSLDWKPELNLIDNINFEPAVVGLSARFTFNK